MSNIVVMGYNLKNTLRNDMRCNGTIFRNPCDNASLISEGNRMSSGILRSAGEWRTSLLWISMVVVSLFPLEPEFSAIVHPKHLNCESQKTSTKSITSSGNGAETTRRSVVTFQSFPVCRCARERNRLCLGWCNRYICSSWDCGGLKWRAVYVRPRFDPRKVDIWNYKRL